MPNTILEAIKIRHKKNKEYIPTLILFPTIIGGLWQIIELMSIDFSLIRFFSITQLVPDGLLILAILIVLTLVIKFFIGRFNFRALIKSSVYNTYSWGSVVLSIIMILSAYYLIRNSILREGLTINLYKNLSFNNQIGILIGMVFILLTGLTGVIILVKQINSLNIKYLSLPRRIFYKPLYNNKDLPYYIYEVFKLFSGAIIILILFYIIVGVFTLRNNIIFPDNLYNFDIALSKIQSKISSKEKAAILYFNDKYLFIEITNSDVEDQKKIMIYKTDEILFER